MSTVYFVFFFFFLSFKNLRVWVMHQIMYFQAFLSNSNFLLSMVNSDVCCSWDTQFFFGREMNTVKNYLDCLLMIGPLVRKGRGKIKNLTQAAFCRCSCNIHKKTPVLEFNFNKVAGVKICNFIKKRFPTQVFSCEYCEILTTFL